MKKLIAMDLDDTLLGKDLRVSPGNQEALARALDRGHQVVLASGRPTAGMHPIAQALDLPRRGGWLVAFNGGQIYNCMNDTILWETGIPRPQGQQLWDIAQEQGLDFLTYRRGKILTNSENPYARVEETLTGLPVEVDSLARETLPDILPKVILLGDPDLVKDRLPKLQSAWGHLWNLTTSKPFFLEVTPPGIEKSSALQRLCDHLGIPRQHTLALGDGMNDLSMIRWAGTGIAMENAVQALKDAAHWVTAAHHEDGVARALEKYELI